MKQIGVDCRFLGDGTVVISQIQIDGPWIPVGQGRQWVDDAGRHVLIRLLDGTPGEIRLNRDSLTWFLESGSGGKTEIV